MKNSKHEAGDLKRYLMWLLFLLLLAFLSVFCSRDDRDEKKTSTNTTVDNKSAHGSTTRTIKITDFKETTKILYVVKDNNALILMDLEPEIKTLHSLSAELREEYLKKRALLTVINYALDRENFDGFKRFVVEMVVVTESDNYGRPLWFSAPNLAILEINRSKASAISAQEVDKISLAQLNQYIHTRQLNVKNLPSL